MKILFVNPPVIRTKNSNAKNNFKIDGLRFRPIFRKIPFIYPIWKRLSDPTTRYGVRAGSRWPWTSDQPLQALHYPFLMAYATSLLKENGFEVELYDAVAQEEYSYSNFISNVSKKNADIIVIETSTPTFDIDIWMAKKLSKFADICLAGPHLTYTAEKLQKKHKFIKYFLKGEYILSALEMAKTKRPGIYEINTVKDLEEIPYPYRDYPEATKYFDFTMPTPQPQLQIYGTKGCPYKCSFCLWPQTVYLRKVVIRKPEAILKEIRHAVKKYGYKSILFDDDTFNVGGTKRMIEICKGLKKIGLPWSMMGRLDASTDEVFDKMVESGCVGMRFGVETFDKKVLKNINKGLERIDFQQTIERLSTKYPKLMIRLFMMKNLPGQTEETHKNDMKILKNLGFSLSGNIYRQIQLSNTAPFPGTKMYDDLKKLKGEKALKNYKLYDGGQTTIMDKL